MHACGVIGFRHCFSWHAAAAVSHLCPGLPRSCLTYSSPRPLDAPCTSATGGFPCPRLEAAVVLGRAKAYAADTGAWETFGLMHAAKRKIPCCISCSIAMDTLPMALNHEIGSGALYSAIDKRNESLFWKVLESCFIG